MTTTLAEAARRLKARRHTILPTLWLLTDTRRLPDPLPAARALPRGAGVILRHYDAPDRPALARALARLCRSRGLILLVAGDAKLAGAVGADGLHLAEHEVRRIATWRRQRPHWIVTIAAHSQRALRRARYADLALLSPVFPTKSHPGARTLGPLRFARLCRTSPVPVAALGGINAANTHRLRGAGHVAFAAIGALSD
jgi:thiamine-phosphate pyrophosphorylase